ncbi:unnamed protein product [Coffea canephora]|uniref:Uncharacterized protein n=1 Tax=Coffea canephora TaxID=49390 RepID=A0A068V3H5_COFCA|nr:unnamed protein product [Coffea canephora]
MTGTVRQQTARFDASISGNSNLIIGEPKRFAAFGHSARFLHRHTLGKRSC